MTPILYPLVLAALGAGASGEEAVKPPAGPQPQVTVAHMTDNGKLVIRQLVTVPQVVTVPKTITQDGVARTVNVNQIIYRSVEQVRAVAGKDVQGYDTNGKKLDGDTVRRRLKKDRPVVISADGQPVDPFYLRLMREGTLVLVIPPSANTGTLNPVPLPPREAPVRLPPQKD